MRSKRREEKGEGRKARDLGENKTQLNTGQLTAMHASTHKRRKNRRKGERAGS